MPLKEIRQEVVGRNTCGFLFAKLCVMINTVQSFNDTWNSLSKLNGAIADWNTEFDLHSSIDDDYKPKGYKDLREFTKKSISYTSDDLKSFVTTTSLSDTDDIYVFYDADTPAAMCAVNSQLELGHIWITAIEVVEEYRGYGLSKQLVEFCKSLGADLIGVSEKNEVAKKVYTECGFIEVGKCDDGSTRLWLPDNEEKH